MSSGTQVTVTRYYNHYHFRTKEELAEAVRNSNRELTECKESLFALCLATPRDITPQGEDPVAYMRQAFEEAWELYIDADYRNQALADIEEGWETRGED